MVAFPSEIAEQFGAADLYEQFMLARRNGDLPGEWRQFESGGWCLAVSGGIPVNNVIGPGGDQVGFILGYAITERGDRLSTALQLGKSDLARPFRCGGELDALGGRFAVFVLSSTKPFVYGDPCASLGLVYSPDREVVASTGALIRYEQGTADNASLIRAIGVPDSGKFFPLGLMPRKGIHRLLPNHYLDLNRWRAVRHWPMGDLSLLDSAPDAVDEIADILERQQRALAAQDGVQFALTAGQDSRALLACARGFAGNLDTFTLQLPDDDTAAVDIQIARRLARIAGLRHRVLTYQRNQPGDSQRWLYRSDCAVGEVRGIQSARTRMQLDPAKPEIVAVLAEMGRAPGWRRLAAGDSSLLDVLLTLAGMSEIDEVRDKTRAWLDELPAKDPHTVLDLFYLENRVACWAGPICYSDSGTTGFRFFPFSQRRIVELILKLPVEYRDAGNLCPDIVRMRWPELMALPINKPVGVLKARRQFKAIAGKASRLMANPTRLAGRIMPWLNRK